MDNYPDGMTHEDLVHVGEDERLGKTYDCSECDSGICTGDKYVEIDSKRYHIECLEEMTTKEILKLLDVDIVKA